MSKVAPDLHKTFTPSSVTSFPRVRDGGLLFPAATEAVWGPYLELSGTLVVLFRPLLAGLWLFGLQEVLRVNIAAQPGLSGGCPARKPFLPGTT